MPRSTQPSLWQRFRRSRFAMLCGALLALVVLVTFVREVVRRYEVGQDIRRLEAQVTSLEERKSNLTNLISYFESPLFQEQEGRDKLGLAKPGESVVIVPSSENGSDALRTVSANTQTPRSQNPQRWWRYFFNSSPKN